MNTFTQQREDLILEFMPLVYGIAKRLVGGLPADASFDCSDWRLHAVKANSSKIKDVVRYISNTRYGSANAIHDPL